MAFFTDLSYFIVYYQLRCVEVMKPFVSIVIVNFNGRHLLQDCLSSVFAIRYPKDRYEVIVVDNNSTDSSVSFIRAHFPKTIVLSSPTNQGFTGGNNLGIEYGKGEYTVLLNSDTSVDPDWLTELVKTAQKQPETGIVCSRIRFAVPFVELKIHSQVILRSEIEQSVNFSPIGILLENISCATPHLTPLIYYESGFYEKTSNEITLRWSKAESTVLLPLDIKKQSTSFTFIVHGYPDSSPKQAKFFGTIGNKKVFADSIPAKQIKQITVKISHQDIASEKIWLMQNAGSIILSDGQGKDRGSLVYTDGPAHKDFYERESEYYQTERSVPAFCGASCLFKREMIQDIGAFYPDFFMYYEDLDLSLRAWERNWDIVYQPKSIVYHKHKQSTNSVGSYFFFYHVEKNHILLLLRHFSLVMVFFQVCFLLLRTIYAFISMNMFILSENLFLYDYWRQTFEARKDAIIFLGKNFFKIFQERRRLQKSTFKQPGALTQHLY